jgi:hypothetical protein
MRDAAFLFTALATAAVCLRRRPAKHEPPVEQQPADPKAAKIVLVAGSNYFKAGEHEYVANCAVLADLLSRRRTSRPYSRSTGRRSRDVRRGEGGRVPVRRSREASGDQGERLAEVQKLMDAKVGFVQLHQTADYPKDLREKARGWAGGAWEKGKGERAHWVATFDAFPDHPSVPA